MTLDLPKAIGYYWLQNPITKHWRIVYVSKPQGYPFQVADVGSDSPEPLSRFEGNNFQWEGPLKEPVGS